MSLGESGKNFAKRTKLTNYSATSHMVTIVFGPFANRYHWNISALSQQGLKNIFLVKGSKCQASFEL